MVGKIELIGQIDGHTDRVWQIAFEPNSGELLASCSSDKTVCVYRKQRSSKEQKKLNETEEEIEDWGGKWKLVCRLEGVHERTIRSIAWSPCGRFLASASFDATTAIYQRVDRLRSSSTFAKDFGQDDCDDDGANAKAGEDDDDDENDNLNKVEFECVAALEGHENEVKSCAWSPSGSLLATCGRDKSVWIWESAPGNHFECVAVLHGHEQDVKRVRWHESEDVLYSVSYDDTIKIWREDADGDDWSCAGTIGKDEGGHLSTVWDLAQEKISNGGRFASVSDDRTIKIWKAAGSLKTEICANPQSTFACGHDRPVLCVDWLANDYDDVDDDNSNNNNKATLVCGAGDNSLRVYCEKEEGVWEEAATFANAHEDDVNDVQWIPSNNKIKKKTTAAAVIAGEQATTTMEIDNNNYNSEEVNKYKDDGSFFASASDDFKVKIWKYIRE